MEQAAQKVQEEVTQAYEEAERALELLRHEGENETEELTTEGQG
jgi:DNA-directed RNA polymerase subunit beta'